MRYLGWLRPGLGIKRYMVLFAAAIFLLLAGLAIALEVDVLATMEEALRRILSYGGMSPLSRRIAGLNIIILGLFLVFRSFQQIIRTVVDVIAPEGLEGLPEAIYQRKQLERGPRVVVIGGGTGLSVLLRGLKEYTSNITAIVTVSDDGGSSGRLRGELGILPPGDIRNCLVALADTEPLMESLFQHRFSQGGLAGHSFGNLFIGAMAEVTGDFEEAVRQSSKVLAIRGKVLPSTTRSVVLTASMTDGSWVRGETSIARSGKKIHRVHLEPGNVSSPSEALKAIAEADVIILGPGSLYTSVIPNLLVDGIPEALRESRGSRIYVCNIMTQPGETVGFSAADHLQAIIDHAGPGLVQRIVVNLGSVPEPLLRRYRGQGAEPVPVDRRRLQAMGMEILEGDLISSDDFVRHDYRRLAAIVMKSIPDARNRFFRAKVLEYVRQGMGERGSR
ncbi:MAG: YvcK family protein [Firmicutes bacterium]|nr:YvcK family protein [Bacillota bacterium]